MHELPFKNIPFQLYVAQLTPIHRTRDPFHSISLFALLEEASQTNPTPPDPSFSQFNPHLPFNQVWNIERKVSELQIADKKPSFLFSGIPSPTSSTNIFPPTPTRTPMTKEMEEEKIYEQHMSLLSRKDGKQELGDAITTPVFTMPVLEHVRKRLVKETETPFAQYGLLARVTGSSEENTEAEADAKKESDKRLFFNIASPSSTFICGSQGSGKSHTLSCLLENSMFPSIANQLPHPLTGLVFHYDPFMFDDRGSPCEAAFLSSHKGVKVRVLCAPTNIATIEEAYDQLENVTVEPFRISQSDLSSKRMLDLMAVNQTSGPMPLYLHKVKQILRKMGEEQQEKMQKEKKMPEQKKTGATFDYDLFRKRVDDASFSPDQLKPLQQRLDTLESFMPPEQTVKGKGKEKEKKKFGPSASNDWTPKAGTLTIVDLSCPFVTPDEACSLFNICLSIFLEKDASVGRIIALDEAHKYMTTSSEAETFTKTLLSTICEQRHLAARVIISTQEPTISPALLDLSSVTIVHRFNSPEWFKTLEGHLAGASSNLLLSTDGDEEGGQKISIAKKKKVFDRIVDLGVGEALLFSPSAIIGVNDGSGKTGTDGLKKLGAGFLEISVRSRLTTDGGKSVMSI
ncbi:hypothetical protein LAWI1_G004174 [Lachnellula willkommii]|uniref:Zona occludens toxin N-terminal domain-containing protein n=1 Tax=Lachnellula willkommii TaxID=215461 RepID=A0A559MHH7_9HELO|nr:hypothetical protein LAWI1_G004174 [Lachnellula willkommii]